MIILNGFLKIYKQQTIFISKIVGQAIRVFLQNTFKFNWNLLQNLIAQMFWQD